MSITCMRNAVFGCPKPSVRGDADWSNLGSVCIKLVHLLTENQATPVLADLELILTRIERSSTVLNLEDVELDALRDVLEEFGGTI